MPTVNMLTPYSTASDAIWWGWRAQLDTVFVDDPETGCIDIVRNYAECWGYCFSKKIYLEHTAS